MTTPAPPKPASPPKPEGPNKSTSPTGAVAPKKKLRKPYEEISAMFNGNEVKIRVPKNNTKASKLTPSQQLLMQECTCEDDMSACSSNCGLSADGQDNRLNLVVPDDMCEALSNRTAFNSEMVYTKAERHQTRCEVCNVTPQNAPKGVKAQKVLRPDKDVFLLKIGKQTDEPHRTGNIEVELITPRAPAKRMPQTHACVNIQCDEQDLPCCMPCRGVHRAVCRPACRPVVPRRKRKCFC